MKTGKTNQMGKEKKGGPDEEWRKWWKEEHKR
jgi:hypothetical protein